MRESCSGWQRLTERSAIVAPSRKYRQIRELTLPPAGLIWRARGGWHALCYSRERAVGAAPVVGALAIEPRDWDTHTVTATDRTLRIDWTMLGEQVRLAAMIIARPSTETARLDQRSPTSGDAGNPDTSEHACGRPAARPVLGT
jgi:hypothetical protein